MRSVPKQVDYFFETDSAAKCLLSSVRTVHSLSPVVKQTEEIPHISIRPAVSKRNSTRPPSQNVTLAAAHLRNSAKLSSSWQPPMSLNQYIR